MWNFYCIRVSVGWRFWRRVCWLLVGATLGVTGSSRADQTTYGFEMFPTADLCYREDGTVDPSAELNVWWRVEYGADHTGDVVNFLLPSATEGFASVSGGGSPSGNLCQSHPSTWASDAFFMDYLQRRARWSGVSLLEKNIIEALALAGTFTTQLSTGWSFLVDVSWLALDDDADGIQNLYDLDATLNCGSDVFGCATPIIAPDGGVGGGSDPVYPDIPHLTGSAEDFFGCNNPVYGSGLSVEDTRDEWCQARWLSPWAFAVPSGARPYDRAYNLVRVGPGGSLSAFISAPWGKKLAYVSKDQTTALDAFQYIETAYWHRYVIIGGYFQVQYYRSGDDCWAPIGLDFGADTDPIAGMRRFPDGNPKVYLAVSVILLNRYVPMGYGPADYSGEIDSNEPDGVGVFPNPYVGPTATGFWYQSGLAGSSGAVTSGGTALSGSEVEEAMFSALARASRGQSNSAVSALAQNIDQGSVEGVTTILGAGYESEGVTQAPVVKEHISSMTQLLHDRLMQALQLQEVSPEVRGEAVYPIEIPKPGGGLIEFELSTLPDPTTPVGSAMDSTRIIMRLVLAFFCSFEMVKRWIKLWKDLT